MENLKNKRVLIIGASSGIGKAIAQQVAQQGGIAMMASRSLEKLQEASKDIDGVFELYPFDMLNETDVANTFNKIESIDHLVITAVADENTLRSSLKNSTKEIAEKSLQKFWGAMFCCRAAVDKLSKNGSIILTSSIAIYRPSSAGDMSILTAGHGAVTAFATALAVELAPIRVNVIAPGVVSTSVWSESQKDNLEKWANEKLLVKHLGSPEELADAYISLMTNTYITGSILKVDGGLTLI